jgi:hypothetical protein
MIDGQNYQYNSDSRVMLEADHPYNSRAPSHVRKAREASLPVKLFNSIPRELRDLNHSKVDSF